VNGVLQATLNNLIQSRSRPNPAMNALINDYILFHVVRVVAGGLLVVIFVLLSRFFWLRWKRLPRSDERKWTFERKTYFAFGTLSTVVGVLMNVEDSEIFLGLRCDAACRGSEESAPRERITGACHEDLSLSRREAKSVSRGRRKECVNYYGRK